MARHDLRLAINEDRHVKAKHANAVRDLTNLFLRMQSGILRIEREVCDRPRDHFEQTHRVAVYRCTRCVAVSSFPHGGTSLFDMVCPMPNKKARLDSSG